MPRASFLVSSCAALFGVCAACGARTGLPTGADTCTGTPVGQVRQVPNVYFIIDRSGSMVDGTPVSKWTTVRSDIANLMVRLGKDAEFGATVFPDPTPPPPPAPNCQPGVEIMKLRHGDGLPETRAGSTASVFLAATDITPSGGTPTAATFRALTGELSKLRHTFAILATDGGPNCNSDLSCGDDQCTKNIDSRGDSCFVPPPMTCTPTGPNCCVPNSCETYANVNCLDGPDAIEAIGKMASAGVPTYVIGIPGSEAYDTILEGAAQAGGTDHYYAVDTSVSPTSPKSLVNALTNIADRIAASCELELKHAPAPDQTNVLVGGKLVPQGGWKVSGNLVTLFGSVCTTVRLEGQPVVVTEGCPSPTGAK
jgi:hypothetical protein